MNLTAESLFTQAEAFTNNGDPLEAIRNYLQIMELFPDNKEAIKKLQAVCKKFNVKVPPVIERLFDASL